MAKAKASTWPILAGGRTLKKPRKPGGSGGKKTKRRSWFQDTLTGQIYGERGPRGSWPVGQCPYVVKEKV